ncbi:OLC1v1032508C2 [Oldenlandia corymbosa var. corymbosa]|uniref:OLC1v1032508C2 n=1 Tax=Oldenlandia corymbosa var. corymbosa TaxID=529605 RepID=A0AAV1CML6_OLDCO|nr:OLC1v1032508C2 [Oldenlandia corymbosa var. corymbosa]
MYFRQLPTTHRHPASSSTIITAPPPPQNLQCSFFTDLSSSKCCFYNTEIQQCSPSSHRPQRSFISSSKTASSERSIEENRGAIMEAEEAALVICSCITKVLPPALTLEEGLNKIDEAIQHLKSMAPPSSSSGMFRFQVTVPPSSKALNWFCCQPESDGVFPQFYMSNEKNSPTCKTLTLGRDRGVFGIGSAIHFNCRYSNGPENDSSSTRRCLSVESNIPRVYGVLDTRYDKSSSSAEHETGSFYLFIPQIELNEFTDTSILVATLAWNNSYFRSFEEAIRRFDLSLSQARQNFWASAEERSKNYIASAASKFNMVEDKSFQMVGLDSLQVRGSLLQVDAIELASDLSSQFSARFSPTMAIANNMYQNNQYSLTSYLTRDCPNMNILWATLIVEECVRLGITYFCIAPGARSALLTIAASSHPLATCAVCIDERSLTFNALGYAKGSCRPAAVIVTSGTAVSNLLSAVVEASEDFVPLLLLTADRSPELLDAGALQAINQVNHFGQFAKHSFSLPVPTDDISAKMVLTTLDSAVYLSTTSPYGPIHINCPFGEPIGYNPTTWERKCLNGLEDWMLSSEPFTTYSQLPHSIVSNQSHGIMVEVVKLIQGAKRGILVLGALHTEDDMWAALFLAKHLSWPVVATILSGLRLRKYVTSFSEIEENIIFLDHLDHVLFSDAVKDWMQADVIVQVGGQIASKRISQMIECCFPCPYIMIDKHPMRHDPSHIVTHRIQSAITDFSHSIIKFCSPSENSQWKAYLQVLNLAAARETSSLIAAECSLTEPYIARIALENFECESAIFVGNSMPIRDADNFGYSGAKCNHKTSEMLNSGFQCHGIQVACNRGAGGIDGQTSAAVGFAVGCNKRVLLLIGDVSFLYDTNGLSLLRQGVLRKPVIIIVINNQGGAVFSLLPYASSTDHKIMDKFFYTSHDVQIGQLCMAHGCLGKFVRQAVDHSFDVLSKISMFDIVLELSSKRIAKMEFCKYRIPLLASSMSSSSVCYREGFVISLSLEGGATGFGEVTPIEIIKENQMDVEDQLQFLIHAVKGGEITDFVLLLNGSFASWLWKCLGILPDSLLPSVRCGLEMAILNAIAASKKSSLRSLFYPRAEELPIKSSNVQICGLIDSNGSPIDMASAAVTLVEDGFTAIKIKVGRRASPIEDVMVIQEIRKKVGNDVVLRVDANRSWTFSEAVEFANLVKNSNLQYIEEPVRDEDAILKFCEETGLPVALDETINTRADPVEVLKKYTHSGVVAVVIRPSMIGGFEKAASVARWAQQQGKLAVVGSTLESGLGLSSYVQFSSYIDLQGAELCSVINQNPPICLAHDLGTYKWLKEDVSTEPLGLCGDSDNGFAVTNSCRYLRKFQINQNVIVQTYAEEVIHEYQLPVDSEGTTYSLNVVEMGKEVDPRLSVENVAGARLVRQVKDDFRASSLVSYGLENFLDSWYTQEMWNSLRSHPHFSKIITNRLQHGDLNTLARVLSDSSVGRQQPLWEDLKKCSVPLLLVVGDQDTKFKGIAKEMLHKMSDDARREVSASISEIPNAGHAVHVENPLSVIYAIRKFLNRVNNLPSYQ